MTCPCCSENAYETCCEPYHRGNAFAPTAEKLMRSRFAAFAIPNGTYLLATTHPKVRHQHDEKDLQEWGEINQWTQLEILQTPTPTEVEFKAHYIDENGKPQVHHEHSTFKYTTGKWYYLKGKFLS